MTIVADPIPATLPEVAPLAPVLGVMPDTIAVVVRPEHIANGKPGGAFSCAVALALWDQGYRAAVGEGEAIINGTRYAIGTELKHWIRCFDRGRKGRFDRGHKVTPERFVLHRVKDK